MAGIDKIYITSYKNYIKMLEKYKVFVRGSIETKKILGEIAEKRNIYVNNYEHSDNPEYQFGKCPPLDSNFAIWYTDSNAPKYFINWGYKEVTPEQFREIWLGEESPKKENEPRAFCCRGDEKLREVCQRLTKEGFINALINDCEPVLYSEFYYFKSDHRIYYKDSGAPNGEIVSPEEFYERISGKPWKERKIYLGFIGDADVHIEFLPNKIKNPKHLKGTSRNCIFYIENNELTYCVIGKEPKDVSFEIVSYFDFVIELSKSKLSEQLKVEHPLTPEDCFESKQKTKETNFVQSFVKNPSENFLYLSEEKPLKIIL